MSRRGRKRRVAALAVGALAVAVLAVCGGCGSAGGTARLREKTDSPLLEFGREGTAAEQRQATEAVSDFLSARSEGDWKAACAQLAGSMVEKLERLASNSTGLADTSCASFLETFTRLSQDQRSETAADDGVLRWAGERGFLIYLGSGESAQAMPLASEAGEWKVAAISARPLS